MRIPVAAGKEKSKQVKKLPEIRKKLSLEQNCRQKVFIRGLDTPKFDKKIQ